MKLTQEEKAKRAAARKEARETAKELLRIESEKNQKPVKSLTILIEWKKSRTWGANPHATAEVSFQDGTFERQNGFKCSGCGYDKTSTVVAEIFNRYLKYKLWAKSYEDCRGGHGSGDTGQAPYGIRIGKYKNIEYRGFSGGIGMSCYPAISEFIGGNMETVATGNSFDVFRYTD